MSSRGSSRRRLTALAGLALFGIAGLAAAASGGSVVVTLSPDHPSARSTLKVSASGPFPQVSGTLTSARLATQRGFSSSAKSVQVLCTAGQESDDTCPGESNIGAGTATVTITGGLGTVSRQDTLTFSLFLGVPSQSGDIASVLISGSDSLFHQSAHAVGRLLEAPGGGLEVRFDQLPTYSLPPGTKVTLDQLSFSAHAMRTVVRGRRKHRHRIRYSLITNPARCSGRWLAELSLTFSDGSSYRRSVSAPCKRR